MTDEVRCADCRRFKLKGADLAKHGFGNCEAKKEWEHYSATYPRECSMFSKTDDETIKARAEWINNRRKKP